jgi:hypothetical protein
VWRLHRFGAPPSFGRTGCGALPASVRRLAPSAHKCVRPAPLRCAALALRAHQSVAPCTASVRRLPLRAQGCGALHRFGAPKGVEGKASPSGPAPYGRGPSGRTDCRVGDLRQIRAGRVSAVAQASPGPARRLSSRPLGGRARSSNSDFNYDRSPRLSRCHCGAGFEERLQVADNPVPAGRFPSSPRTGSLPCRLSRRALSGRSTGP